MINMFSDSIFDFFNKIITAALRKRNKKNFVADILSSRDNMDETSVKINNIVVFSDLHDDTNKPYNLTDDNIIFTISKLKTNEKFIFKQCLSKNRKLGYISPPKKEIIGEEHIEKISDSNLPLKSVINDSPRAISDRKGVNIDIQPYEFTRDEFITFLKKRLEKEEFLIRRVIIPGYNIIEDKLKPIMDRIILDSRAFLEISEIIFPDKSNKLRGVGVFSGIFAQKYLFLIIIYEETDMTRCYISDSCTETLWPIYICLLSDNSVIENLYSSVKSLTDI